MRSAPAWAACSKTRLDPSTFSSRVASLALRIAKARCTTTSAPWTRSRTLASSVTSPWRYSVLRQPRSPGSNGRRAMRGPAALVEPGFAPGQDVVLVGLDGVVAGAAAHAVAYAVLGADLVVA